MARIDRKQVSADYVKYLKYTKGFNLEVLGANYTERLSKLLWVPTKGENGKTEDFALGEIVQDVRNNTIPLRH